MGKARLEAFSDGVLAIIITIMVLELKLPTDATFGALAQRWPVFLSYALSFTFVGIYWGNHHHLIHSVRHVTPGVIWSNLHLLFWLSIIPYVTQWMGVTSGEATPIAVYGVVLICCGLGYQALQTVISAQQVDEAGKRAHSRQSKKGIASLFIYLTAIGASFFVPRLSVALYVVVALMWLVPERTFEKIKTQPG